MIEALLEELKELRKLEDQIVSRVWSHSPCAIDLEGTELTGKNIKNRIAQLALAFTREFPLYFDATTTVKYDKPVLIGLMDGADPFASLFKKELDEGCFEYDYTTMQASSYGDGLVSGALRIGSLPKVDLTGRHVVILDDVCDTGNTLMAILALLEQQCPASLKTMVLVDKVQDRKGNYTPDFSGFKLDKNAFIIGMGLDYRHTLRNKHEIHTANLDFLPTPEEEAKLARIPVLIEEIKRLHAARALNTDGLLEKSLFAPALDKQTSMPPSYGLHQ